MDRATRVQRVTNLLLLCATAALLLTSSGCSRTFWREQADDDSYEAVGERMFDARWHVPRVDVDPDPTSRFYDPFDPDYGPLPPDDPSAHHYMKEVNGMRNYKSWHKFGTALSIENPQWYESLGLTHQLVHSEGDPTAPIEPALDKLSLTKALELSYIHSREYQTAIEDVYLSGLALSQERFRFDVRYLGVGGGRPGATATHTSVPHGRNDLALNSNFGVRRALPSGGQWAVELLNNTLWMFSGTNTTTSASTLSYSLTQPLMFAAGRKVVLEDLTQTERNLLYQVRTLARFRRSFFTDTVVGGRSGGFLGLLQQQQQILNQADNVARLEEQLERVIANAEQEKIIREPIFGLPQSVLDKGIPQGLSEDISSPLSQLYYDQKAGELVWRGGMTPTLEELLSALVEEPQKIDFWEFATRDPYSTVEQVKMDSLRSAIEEIIRDSGTVTSTLTVAQIRSDLANSRNRLRQSRRSFQDSLDQFKIQIGLPPDLKVTIDETLLEPFQLNDPRLLTLQKDFEGFAAVVGEVDFDNPDPEDLKKVVTELEDLAERMRTEGLQIVEKDFDKVKSLLETGEGDSTGTGKTFVREFGSEAERERVRLDVLGDEDIYTRTRSEFTRDYFYDLDSIEDRISRVRLAVEDEEITNAGKLSALAELRELQQDLLKLSQTLQVIQINLRVELIPLNRFTKSLEESVGIALTNRLDLMNSRAQVVDARREVEFRANQLEAVLDIRVEGDIGTRPGGNFPLDFRGRQSNFRAGLGFTAPLDQVTQRNSYRSALINYQRARRDFMALEDSVKFDIRQSFRQLQVLEQNFETARQAIRLATKEYDNAAEDAATQGTGLNILRALSSVLSAQNNLIQIWVSYEQTRLSIYRDMGIMEVDPQGVWIDDFYQQGDSGSSTTPLNSQGIPSPPHLLLPLPEEVPLLSPQQIPQPGQPGPQPGGEGAAQSIPQPRIVPQPRRQPQPVGTPVRLTRPGKTRPGSKPGGDTSHLGNKPPLLIPQPAPPATDEVSRTEATGADASGTNTSHTKLPPAGPVLLPAPLLDRPVDSGGIHSPDDEPAADEFVLPVKVVPAGAEN